MILKWAINGEIIINSAIMYLVNLLSKRFRFSASSEVQNQQKMKKTKLQYLHFAKEIRIEKRDDSKI